MDDNKNLVSIIVPIYGTEAYLADCIESICKQTYKNIQIILVDDQSPDRCPEICDCYAKKDSRITVIHQTNKGVSGARNTGLRKALGKYIMFVDSDDELYPDAVSVFFDDILKYNADIVWAPVQRKNKGSSFNEVSEPNKYDVFQGDDALLLALNAKHNVNAVWSKIFRKSFIDGIYFEEGRKINEDGFFMFQCYIKKPLLVRHDIMLYDYKIRKDSCSREKFSEKYLDMLYFCDAKKKLIEKYYPQYIDKFRNIEILTNLQLLDILCGSDNRNKELERKCIKTVCELRKGHKPLNKHYSQLAWIVAHGLYPFYKKLIRIKYYK